MIVLILCAQLWTELGTRESESVMSESNQMAELLLALSESIAEERWEGLDRRELAFRLAEALPERVHDGDSFSSALYRLKSLTRDLMKDVAELYLEKLGVIDFEVHSSPQINRLKALWVDWQEAEETLASFIRSMAGLSCSSDHARFVLRRYERYVLDGRAEALPVRREWYQPQAGSIDDWLVFAEAALFNRFAQGTFLAIANITKEYMELKALPNKEAEL